MNIIEPNDAVIVGVNGVFGMRIATIVERCGGRPVRVDAPWGHIVDPRAIEVALKQHAPVKAVAVSLPELVSGLRIDCRLLVSAKRAYHHTAPISMRYALREALRVIDEEGLDARVHRHFLNSRALMAGPDALGLTPFAQEGARLTTLHCVVLPPAVDDAWTRMALLHEYGIEIGAGLGPLQGKVWRIGLMGESSTRANVRSLLGALDTLLVKKAWVDRSGLALEAAARIYHEMPKEPKEPKERVE